MILSINNAANPADLSIADHNIKYLSSLSSDDQIDLNSTNEVIVKLTDFVPTIDKFDQPNDSFPANNNIDQLNDSVDSVSKSDVSLLVANNEVADKKNELSGLDDVSISEINKTFCNYEVI